MKWSKPSEDLVTLLDMKLVDIDYEKRKMFGQWAYFFNGNMFVGVFQSDIFFRLSQERKDEIFEKYPDTKPFEPRTGYIMKEYVVFTKGFFRATQGIGIEPRAYEAIQYARKLRKENPKIPPLKLTRELQERIAEVIEDHYEFKIEPVLGVDANSVSLLHS